jgi:hypothetical protein
MGRSTLLILSTSAELMSLRRVWPRSRLIMPFAFVSSVIIDKYRRRSLYAFLPDFSGFSVHDEKSQSYQCAA